MGSKAAPVTVVGMVMCIFVGGAMVREATVVKMAKGEVSNSVVLMGLCHSLMEDTLIMAATGGKLVGIFWGRILFSLAVTYLLVRLFRLLFSRRRQQ